MDILLHICCGPCLVYPFRRLKDQGFSISGFYYNPNIYPASEYLRRVEALEILRQEFALRIKRKKRIKSDRLSLFTLNALNAQWGLKDELPENGIAGFGIYGIGHR